MIVDVGVVGGDVGVDKGGEEKTFTDDPAGAASARRQSSASGMCLYTCHTRERRYTVLAMSAEEEASRNVDGSSA